MSSRLVVSLALSLALVAGCHQPTAGQSRAASPPHGDEVAQLGGACLRALTSLSCAVSPRRDRQAIAHGRTAIASAREMHALYPATRGTISYSRGDVTTATWFSYVSLHDRYTLKLTVPVTLDASLTRVVAQGEPSFLLEELDVYGTRTSPDGSPAAYVVVRSERFGAAGWDAVRAAGGDLAPVLGQPARIHAPVPGIAMMLPDSDCR